MRKILCADVLSATSRARLLGYLRACQTGKDRLRAGLPTTFTVGDKTGTGARGAVNDVAIVMPPGRAPVLVAAYLSEGTAALPSSGRGARRHREDGGARTVSLGRGSSSCDRGRLRPGAIAGRK